MSLPPMSLGIKPKVLEWVGLTSTCFSLSIQIVHSALPVLLLLHDPFNVS